VIVQDPTQALLAGPGAPTLATIWATVDLARAIRELAGRSDADDDGDRLSGETAHEVDLDLTPLVLDPLLGARVVILPPTSPDRPALAVAEPSTEGRLAATLARHGEGPAGRYVGVADGLEGARARALRAGIAVSRVEAGPFGPSMLVLRGPVTGPHLVLCESSAVPSSP